MVDPRRMAAGSVGRCRWQCRPLDTGLTRLSVGRALAESRQTLDLSCACNCVGCAGRRPTHGPLSGQLGSTVRKAGLSLCLRHWPKRRSWSGERLRRSRWKQKLPVGCCALRRNTWGLRDNLLRRNVWNLGGNRSIATPKTLAAWNACASTRPRLLDASQRPSRRPDSNP